MRKRNSEEQTLARFNENMKKNEYSIFGLERRKKELEDKEYFLFECRRQLNFYIEDSREAHAGTSEYQLIEQLDMDIHQEDIRLRRVLDEIREDLKKEEQKLNEQQEKFQQQYRDELNSYHNKEGR